MSGALSAGFSLGQAASAHIGASSPLPFGCHRTTILTPWSLRALLGQVKDCLRDSMLIGTVLSSALVRGRTPSQGLALLPMASSTHSQRGEKRSRAHFSTW